jgi:hypothetical protein
MGQSFELLPTEERIQQYREMADATFLKAQRADDPLVRARYLELAANWHTLARQLEAGVADPQTMTGGMPPESDYPDRGPKTPSGAT